MDDYEGWGVEVWGCANDCGYGLGFGDRLGGGQGGGEGLVGLGNYCEGNGYGDGFWDVECMGMA